MGEAEIRWCEDCGKVAVHGVNRRLCPACARARAKENSRVGVARRAVLLLLGKLPPQAVCPFCGAPTVEMQGVKGCARCWHNDIFAYRTQLQEMRRLQKGVRSAVLAARRREKMVFKKRYVPISGVVLAAKAEGLSYGYYVWQHGLYPPPSIGKEGNVSWAKGH